MRAAYSITINSTKDGAINCYYTNGNLHEDKIDLNRGISNGADVYMHFKTMTKTNRPSKDPVMASGLVYNGQPQQLIKTAASISSGTMKYRMGKSGSWGSWETEISKLKATDPGSYDVQYYAEGNTYGGKSDVITEHVVISDRPDWWTLSSGSVTDPYIILTPEDLIKLANKVNSGFTYNGNYFKLGGNIDMTSKTFSPIGNYQYSFQGNFNGDGKTISGISYTNNTEEYTNVGLFGYISGGKVENIVLSNSTITGCGRVGSIAGFNCGSILNCSVESSVNVKVGSNYDQYTIGGIAGKNMGTIEGCLSAATVSRNGYTGNDWCFGGITGENNGTLKNNLYTGTTINAYGQGGAITGKISGPSNLVNNYYTSSGVENVDEYGARKAVAISGANGVTLALSGTSTTYNVSGITTYDGNNGVKYNGKFYAGISETVNLVIQYSGDKTVPETYVFAYVDNVGRALTDNGNGTYSMNFITDPVTVSPGIMAAPMTGSGTQASPYVIIYPCQLDLLAQEVNAGNSYQDTYFKLGADIAYDPNKANNYTPIGGSGYPFRGTFDGQGNTISGIRISGNNENVGLFGNNEGTVKNLTVSDCYFAGSDLVGTVVGTVVGHNVGSIENCHVEADVFVAGESTVGGVAADNSGSVSGCTSAATINSTVENFTYLGGITGDNYGLLADNLFTGTISVETAGFAIGAITGNNGSENGTLTNNFHTCSSMGGVGNVDNTTNTDEDGAQFAVSNTTKPDVAGEEGTTYGTGNYTGITAYEHALYYDNKYYYFSLWGGSGTEDDPYVIYNTAGMDKLASDVNSGTGYEDTYFVLGNDITYDPDEDNNYTPVEIFYGTFDGQGHTISGIRVNGGNQDDIGVFGVNCGTLKNLSVSDCSFAGTNYIAPVAGKNSGTIENCHVQSSVSVSVSKKSAGGILARNDGQVLGCTSAAVISTGNESVQFVGGIAGENYATMSDNLFTGTIGEVPAGSQGIGAVAGYNSNVLSNNFHTCNEMGGVGNENDATNADEDGAWLAVEDTERPDASIFGVEGTTYGTGNYTGITVYACGLAYNGKYYYKSLWGGSGTEDDPYVIYNTADMDKLASEVNSGTGYEDTYFVLGDNIAYAPDKDNNYTPIGGSGYWGTPTGQLYVAPDERPKIW
ncbi:MAG: hypothetical protein K6D37_07120 [Prevotella sp.]|nr:hypothetical protein [Prevotella sp.]